MIKLFVIGSMFEGMVHFNKIKDLIESTEDAQTTGSVFRLKVGYPVLTLEGQQLIKGQLLTLNATEISLNVFDQIFGYNPQNIDRSNYMRTEIDVQSEQGQFKAWTYVMQQKKLPMDAQLIADGEWLKSLEENPPMTNQLTEKQRNYILKLGSSSSRDVVPIDMNLYRELIKLELIVDKGRRLALTKLGQDLYRYLA